MVLGCARGSGPSGAGLRFAVASDLHYRDSRCGEWLERVAAHIGRLRPAPAFIVLDGDLSEDGTSEQLGAVREIFRPLPMPVRAVIGNHDHSRDGRNEAFRETFPGPLNRRFECGGCTFLSFDSTAGCAVYRTRIREATLAWLRSTVRSIESSKPLVVFTHFPLGRNWLRPMNAGHVMKLLQRHNVRAAFSGHWHGLTQRRLGAAPLVTGRCCSWWRNNHDGSALKGYLLCELTAAGVVEYDFISVQVPSFG